MQAKETSVGKTYAEEENSRVRLNFNRDWKFYRGDVENAQSLDFDDTEKYQEKDFTEKSWAVYQEAVDHANAILAKENATQDEVNDAKAKSEEAAKALKTVEVIPGEPDKEPEKPEKPGIKQW